MKSAGVFVGGLTSVLTMNLMLIGVCSSAPTPMTPAVPPPPPVPAPVVRVVTEVLEPRSEPMPWGTFIWGCGGRISIDPEGALPLPICFNR
jgi:hypothetical protein